MLNDRDNIIVLVDEAHRTQEGDLGRKMRDALPNAFLFGLTGTPINRADKNTFYAFGADTDDGGYASRYGLNDSIRDGRRRSCISSHGWWTCTSIRRPSRKPMPN